MTRFEERGIEIQYNARSISAANKRFQSSCDKCCSRGLRIDCDRCAIAVANKAVVEYFMCHTTAEIEEFYKYQRLAYA